MESQLRVTLSVNAGLILEFEGVKLLLDGIYANAGHPFSSLGPERWEQLLRGSGPYNGIDYLLFTHQHPDHFTPAMTLEYLKARPVKGVFLPQLQDGSQEALLSHLKKTSTPCVPLSAQTEHAVFSIEPRIQVRAFATRHLDKKFWNVPHFCYLVSFGGKHVLFTADMDYTRETLSAVGGRPLRAAFVNPLFFNALRTGRFFHGALDAETLCVYHVPFSEDDRLRMRPILAQDLLAWPREKPQAVVLCSAFQQITL